MGKVYGYALDPTAAPSSRFTITGSVALGEFGHGIAAAGSFVVLAAPDAQGKTSSALHPLNAKFVGTQRFKGITAMAGRRSEQG